jgi:hypothetical protein
MVSKTARINLAEPPLDQDVRTPNLTLAREANAKGDDMTTRNLIAPLSTIVRPELIGAKPAIRNLLLRLAAWVIVGAATISSYAFSAQPPDSAQSDANGNTAMGSFALDFKHFRHEQHCSGSGNAGEEHNGRSVQKI